MSTIPRPACFDFAMDFLGEPEASVLLAYIEQLEKDASRWHSLLIAGRCDSKHSGLSVGDATKAKLAFRYWCSPEEATRLVDQLEVKGKST